MVINNNNRSVSIPCIECNRILRFRIDNDIIVEGEGKIAINVPCVVCEDCVKLLLDRIADPPGLVCFEGLSPILAREILKSLAFLRPRSEAAKFFASLFSEIERGEAEQE